MFELRLEIESVDGGFAALRDALGVAGDAAAGDLVVLTPGCLDPIKGVVTEATRTSLGVRTDEAMYRFHGGEAGGPAGVAHELVGDEAASRRAWRAWLRGLSTSEAGACLTTGRMA